MDGSIGSWSQANVPEFRKDSAACPVDFIDYTLPTRQGLFTVEARHIRIEPCGWMRNVGPFRHDQTALDAAAIIGRYSDPGIPPGDLARVMGAITIRFDKTRFLIAKGANRSEVR
jgi:hypothetical protein